METKTKRPWVNFQEWKGLDRFIIEGATKVKTLMDNKKTREDAITEMVKNWDFRQLNRFHAEEKKQNKCLTDIYCKCINKCKYKVMETEDKPKSIMDYFRILEPNEQLEMFPPLSNGTITVSGMAGEIPNENDDSLVSPHVCPICKGSKKVPFDFYTKFGPNNTEESFLPVECQTCEGEGVLWG